MTHDNDIVNKRSHDWRDEIEVTLIILDLLCDISGHAYYSIVLRNILADYLAPEMCPLRHIKGSHHEQ